MHNLANVREPTLVCSIQYIRMSDHMLQLAWPAQWVTHIACRYCHQVHLHIILPHSISFVKQVCPTVRAHLNDTNRWSGKGQLPRLRMKEWPHCTTYALLPCLCSLHHVLHLRT